MATIVNRRRGTTAQHSTFVGSVGELTVDTDKNVAVIHNAVQAGGFPLAGTLFANVFEEPQTISVLSGAPTDAFDILTDSVSRVTFRKSGFGILHRQEADVSPGGFELTKRGTTGNALAALSSGSAIGTIDFLGWDGAALGAAGGIRMFTNQAFTGAAHGSKLFFTTVPAGSTSTVNSMELDNTALTVLSRLLLPNTTSATVGGIYFGGNRAFHNFGTNNTSAGVNAGNLTMTGASNSFFGNYAGLSNTTGASNSFFGRAAGSANTTGSFNAFFGRSAGTSNTTGIYNSFFGYQAGQLNTTGGSNSFFGLQAGAANTTGANNSFFGQRAGQANTTGTYNAFFGANAGLATTTQGNNSFFGTGAGQANTAIGNSFFGRLAGRFNTTGTNNAFFGLSAGAANTTASSNSFFGSLAGTANTTGYSNSFFGRSAGAANTTAIASSFFGASSGQASTGGSNSFFGASSGAANTSGYNNSFFGQGSGSANTTGANNSLFGFRSGNNLTTGSNNLVFGFDIDSPTATNSNTLTIGNLIFGTGVDGTGTTISSGLVGIKVINPVTELHVVSTSSVDPRGIMSAQHSGDAIGARIHLRKSRGTATAPTTVVTGDVLGRLRFSGYDSANYLQMGSIDVVSVGTIAATRVPTYMAFSTATDAAPSVLTERLRIDQAGKIQILTGVGNDAGGFKHARVTTGSVGAGSTALVTITWTTAFADANYTVNASVLDSTTSSLSLSVVHIESITSAAVTVRVLNNAVGSLTGTVHVIAVHD